MKRIRFITNIISAVLILGYIFFLAARWKHIPETVATHFNAAGKADAYGSKVSLLLEPVLMVLMYLLLTVVERCPSVWNFPVKLTEENRERQFLIGTAMVGALKILIILLFIEAGFSVMFPGFPAWPLYALLILVVVVIVVGIIASVRAR